MMQKRFLVPLILIIAALLISGGSYVTYNHFSSRDVTKPVPKNEQTIFNDLDETVAWYRNTNTLPLAGISTREAFLQETLHKNALKSLRYSFDVARIQASLFETKNADDAQVATEQAASAEPQNPSKMTPEQMQMVVLTKTENLERQLSAAQSELRRAKRNERELISAQIGKISSELTLTKLQSDLLGKIFDKTANDNQTLSLEAQIDNLAATLPELETKKPTTSATGTTSSTPSTTSSASSAAATTLAASQALLTGIPVATASGEQPAADKESKGVLRLVRDLLTLLSQKQDVAELLTETQKLQSQNQDKLEELQTSIIAIVKRSNEMADEQSADASNLVSQSEELNEMTQSFKAMSDLMIPLSKKKRVLVQAEQTLTNWQKLFDESVNSNVARIMNRMVTIMLALLIPFALSEIMRRALSQYVTDARQRRQMNIVRRVILGFAIGLIILLNLVSELGSLATFIGFVTAGLAVALQNVILSIVAHFFFFGRFGIRVGNRISIGSTTGDVVEMGIVRLYLMEMVEEKGQYRATGRIVSFPNSILFQSTAFFKQVPGANYRWHEITLPLAPETERSLARTKLNEAIDSIYKDSKTMLTMQRIAMEKSTRMKVKEPRPEGTIEKTVDSMNLIIRYPVDVEHSDNTDKNVVRQVTEIFERLPAVKLLESEPQIIKKGR